MVHAGFTIAKEQKYQRVNQVVCVIKEKALKQQKTYTITDWEYEVFQHTPLMSSAC